MPETSPETDESEEDGQPTRLKEKPIGRMELDFCKYFGATPTLPKIKKIKANNHAIDSETSVETSICKDMTESLRLERLKEVYERIEEIEKIKRESQALIKSLKAKKPVTTKEGLSITSQENSKSEGGLIFDFTKTPDSNSFSLPAYFHKNMQTLQGILPLTIFNRAWQQAASDNHVDYRKQDKEVEKYRVHPYPGEWSQSRFEWNENMDNFISSCRDTYKYTSFADALEIHKKNVITIFKQQRSWVVAFRYDLTIRKATFAIRNPGDAIPNPSLEPVGLLDEIYYSARAQDDLNTDDNPYRKGGVKSGRNPYSDIITESTPYISNYQTSQRAGPSRYNNDRNQPKVTSPYGNYKGRHFNPNYKKTETSKVENKEKGKEKKL